VSVLVVFMLDVVQYFAKCVAITIGQHVAEPIAEQLTIWLEKRLG